MTPVSLPERLADAEGELPIDTVTIRFARRPDGGLRIVCDELPGLVLSHSDHALVLTDLVPAIETLVFARLAAAESAREAAVAERDLWKEYYRRAAARAFDALDERDAALAHPATADET